jgi:hypothetical protein
MIVPFMTSRRILVPLTDDARGTQGVFWSSSYQDKSYVLVPILPDSHLSLGSQCRSANVLAPGFWGELDSSRAYQRSGGIVLATIRLCRSK